MDMEERLKGSFVCFLACLALSIPAAWFWSNNARETLYEIPFYFSGPLFVIGLTATVVSIFAFLGIWICLFASDGEEQEENG